MGPIQVIYQQECINIDKMVLRPEGLFLKAYEHSAFLLSVNVKAFKPSKSFFKSLGEEVFRRVLSRNTRRASNSLLEQAVSIYAILQLDLILLLL